MNITKNHRILSAILAAIMLLSLTACGGGHKPVEKLAGYGDYGEPYNEMLQLTQQYLIDCKNVAESKIGRLESERDFEAFYDYVHNMNENWYDEGEEINDMTPEYMRLYSDEIWPISFPVEYISQTAYYVNRTQAEDMNRWATDLSKIADELLTWLDDGHHLEGEDSIDYLPTYIDEETTESIKKHLRILWGRR